MRAVVTGGTGFIGSHLCELLRMQGYEVIALSRKKADGAYLGKIGVPVAFGDIADVESLSDVIAKDDLVFHAAAILGAAKASRDEYTRINVEGTANVLEAALRKQAKCLVFASSLQASGPVGTPEKPMTEETPPKPDTLYGESKLEAEKRIRDISAGRMPCVILRAPVVFGPRSNPRSAAARLFYGMRKKTFTVIGDTLNYFPLCYVKNLAQAMVDLSGKKTSGIHTYNVGDGKPYVFKDILMLLRERFGVNENIVHIPYGIAHALASTMEFFGNAFKFTPLLTTDIVDGIALSNYHFDISKALNDGYTPRYTLEEGIRETAEWMET